MDLGSDALGNLTRIENELVKAPCQTGSRQDQKGGNYRSSLTTQRRSLQKPFAFEDELKEKTDRLNALNIELNLNEKDTSVMDTEPEQDDEPPERKCANRER